MLTVATLLWDANSKSYPFSKCYDELWVLRLYNGFKRNLTKPFRFVLFTEKDRGLPDYIIQERLSTDKPDYGHCIEPYKMGVPMILCGLDTVVVGNCDHFAEYCETSNYLALPIDPYNEKQSINGVALVPRGKEHIYEEWKGDNDMAWLRAQPHKSLDWLFPGQIVSYKGHVKSNGLGDARIVYFHGREKPHELDHDWIKENWCLT